MVKIKALKTPYKYFLLVIVFISLLIITIKAIPSIKFEYDESQWIHTSTYYEVLLTQPPDSSYWDENYWTITQPPMARYIIGFARRLGGIQSSELNTPWDFDASYEENVAKNRLPSDRLLYLSRLPMAILMSLTGTILFFIFLESTGLIGAGIFLLFFIFSEFLRSNFVRAMGEAPFFFFVTLSTLFTLLAIKELVKVGPSPTNKSYGKYYGLLFTASIFCGLAGASKINGLISCAAIGMLIFMEGIFFSPNLNRDQKSKLIIRSSFVILFATLFAFILVNPYLYRSPFVSIGRMFKIRLEVMALQVETYPQNHISSMAERIPLLFRKVFYDNMPFRFFGAAFLYLLFFIGGFLSMIRNYLNWHKTGADSPNLLILTALVLPLALAGYNTPLSWGRYLVPCVFLNAICVPAGVYAAGLFLARKLNFAKLFHRDKKISGDEIA